MVMGIMSVEITTVIGTIMIGVIEIDTVEFLKHDRYLIGNILDTSPGLFNRVAEFHLQIAIMHFLSNDAGYRVIKPIQFAVLRA